jgi:hypothetical protein
VEAEAGAVIVLCPRSSVVCAAAPALGDVGGDGPGLVAGEQLGRRSRLAPPCYTIRRDATNFRDLQERIGISSSGVVGGADCAMQNSLQAALSFLGAVLIYWRVLHESNALL